MDTIDRTHYAPGFVLNTSETFSHSPRQSPMRCLQLSYTEISIESYTEVSLIQVTWLGRIGIQLYLSLNQIAPTDHAIMPLQYRTPRVLFSLHWVCTSIR